MFERSKKAVSLMNRLTAVVALTLLALALAPRYNEAYALYIVSDEEYVQVDELDGEVFLTDSSAGLVSRKDGKDLQLTAGQAVTVYYQDKVLSATTCAETINALLRRLDITPSPLEMVSVMFQDGSLEIQVASEFVFYEHITDETEHEIVYQYNDELPAWQETVLQEGSDGEYREVYEVVYQDGEETARQLIEVTETEAVPTIIEKGTVSNFANNGDSVSSIVTNSDGSGSITLENGEVLTFSEARNMKGTAYTTGGKVGTITASGTTVHVGVVAVDKSVLPLGSKVYVVSNDGEYVYGFAVAEDTGVRGNVIDLYMDTYNECIQFGVRSCTVYVLD